MINPLAPTSFASWMAFCSPYASTGLKYPTVHLNRGHLFDRARQTHEEYGSFEPSVSGRFYLTEHLSVGDILCNSDLRAELGKTRKFGRLRYRI